MGDWVWQATGTLQVVLDGEGEVTNTTPQLIPGSQFGAFTADDNTCSFEAPAEVNISITGSCSESILSLNIWEDWAMGTYDWVCDDDTFSFDLPPMQMPPAQHNIDFILGVDGTYTFEIPFGGGQGTKTYTLQP